MSIIDRKLLIVLVALVMLMTIVSIPNNAKMGEIYFKSYKYDLALEYYNKAKALDSDSPIILRQLKDYFLVQGEVEKALQMQQKVTQVLSKNREELEELIKLYEWTNNPYESLKAQERLARQLDHDERIAAFHQIGQGYRWLRKYDDADRIAEQLDTSDRIDFLVADLEYYVSSANFEKVIELTERLKNLGVNTPKFKLLQAQSFEIQGQTKEAIKAYKRYLSDNPQYHTYESYKIVPNARFHLENLRTYEKLIYLYQILDDRDYLVNLYEEIFRVVDSEYEIGLSAAVIRYERKEIEATKEILHRIYSSYNYRDLYRSGDIFRLMKNYKNARKHFEKAYELAPNNAEVIEALADVYEELGLNNKALQLQYKLLRILEQKQPTSGNYYIQFNSELYAQNAGSTPVNKTKEQMKRTQERILYLLEKIGDKERRHEELLRYVKLYPYDLRIKRELAYSHQGRGEESEARKVFEEVYNVNPLDKDASLFLADHHLQNGNDLEALKILERFPIKYRSYDVLNRLEAIYRRQNSEKSASICNLVQKQKKKPRKNYAYVDLVARCYSGEGDHQNAAKVLTEYLRHNPNNSYAKLSLAYALADDNRFVEAKSVAKQIETNKETTDDLNSLNKYVESIELDYLHSNAWLFKTYAQGYSQDFDGLSYWDIDFKILKYNRPWAYGVSYSLQDPIYSSDLISDIKFHLLNEKVNKYNSEFYVGKNISNHGSVVFGLNWQRILSSRSNFMIDMNYNRQVFALDVFNKDQEPVNDNITLSYSIDSSIRNSFFYALEVQRFKILDDSEELTYGGVSFQWLHAYNKQFWYGPFFNYQIALQEDPFIATSLSEQTSTACLKTRYQTHFWSEDKPYSNEIEACTGLGQSKEEGTGFFISAEDIFTYDINKSSNFEARIKLDQIILNRNLRILSIYLGYQRWIF